MDLDTVIFKVHVNSLLLLFDFLLGVLYHRWGQLDKATEMYKKALQINPGMKTTESNLRKLQNAQ